jgi:hypothetical protein
MSEGWCSVLPMSKTDKHRPFRAQVPDSPREWHDHTNGVCDLPTLEEWQKMTRKQQHAWKSCGWQPSNWHTYKGFGRTKGERYWMDEERKRKDSKRAKDEDYGY